jgi:hypothetical protein
LKHSEPFGNPSKLTSKIGLAFSFEELGLQFGLLHDELAAVFSLHRVSNQHDSRGVDHRIDSLLNVGSSLVCQGTIAVGH